MSPTKTAQEKSQNVRLLLSDVDGVLTDGRLIYSGGDVETKEFHVRDGLAVKLWRNCGYKFGLITARNSESVARRGQELHVDFLLQSKPEKLKAVMEIASQENIELSDIGYVGDDLHDLSAVEQVGFGVAVGDAAAEVQQAADHVLSSPGGHGALRELVEFILKSKDDWSKAIQHFSAKT